MNIFTLFIICYCVPLRDMSNNSTALIIGIIFLLGLFAGGGAVYLLSSGDSTSNDIESDSNSGENLDDDEKNEFDDKSDDSDNINPQTNSTSNLKVLALHGGGESSSSFQNHGTSHCPAG